MCHRTVRCTKRSNDYQRNGRLQRTPANATVRAKVRAAARDAPDSEQYLSGATRRQSSNGRPRPNPNGWVTWLAHRTVSGGAPDCVVRPSTAACPNSELVVEGYKYPQHHHPNHPSIPHIAFNTRAIDFNPRHKSSDRSTQSPEFNSSALGLVRGSLVFLVTLVCLAWLSFLSHFLLSSFVSEARDTNCVVVLAGSK